MLYAVIWNGAFKNFDTGRSLEDDKIILASLLHLKELKSELLQLRLHF
jgi:hypothetical protein